MAYRKALASVALMFGLVACGGGGGGGGGTSTDGLILDRSGTVASSQYPASYKINTLQGHAYSTRLVSATGDADILVALQPPSTTSSTVDIVDYSMSTGVDDVSYIVPANMELYNWIYSMDVSSSFHLQVYNNHLAVDGAAYTRTTQSETLYFSFDAVAGQAYNVKVTPVSGDPNLSVYAGTKPDWLFPDGLVPDSATLIGSSSNTGTQAESIVFVASETKTHYFAVSNADSWTDASFSASVETSTAAPDLQVTITGASYSSGNLTVDYTVTNTGVANAVGANLHFWLDAQTPPAAGSTGDDQLYISGIAPGTSVSGSRTINAGALQFGTLYAYIDPEDAVVEADETNNASAGWEWAAPVSAPQTFDFEDSLTPSAFSSSGDAGWSTIAGGAYAASNYSFRSSTITANQSSCFQVAVTGVTRVTFDWKALTDTSADSLTFYMNGWSYLTYSGADVWASTSYTTYSTGLNTFKWCYSKGSTDNAAVNDGGWVDNIVFEPELPDLSVTLDSVVSDGANLTVNYTVNNNTTAASAATTVDFWADMATAPTVGSIGDVQLSIPVIAGNSSYTGTATVPSTAVGGTAYAIIDTANAVSEQNEANNVSTGQGWATSVAAPQTFDFENGIMPAAMYASLDAGWQIDSTTASGGTQSMRASTITHYQSACTAISVSGSSSISFDWMVSSEGSFDYLRFYIDGTQQNAISGVSAWATKQYTGLTLGTHEFKWCYTKDGSVNSNADTGWVDNIQIN